MWSGETVIQTGAVGATTASSAVTAASTSTAAAAAAAFSAVQAVAAAAGVVAARHQQMAALIQDAATAPKGRHKHRHLTASGTRYCVKAAMIAYVSQYYS
eukprot:21367-Heterococcus_DN1.PRE.4